MKISDFMKASGAKLLTEGTPDSEIVCGYTCDLLSHVMGKGVADMAWITVQTHMNVVAVASLHDFACVIIPEGLPVDSLIINKAAAEGIPLLSSEKSAYELVGLLFESGVPAAKKD